MSEYKENKNINLFNIGTKFGVLTKGLMTSYYEEETYKPHTPANVQALADKGYNINIRPATNQEMNWAYKELGKYYYNN
jgi:hypothetical protein